MNQNINMLARTRCNSNCPFINTNFLTDVLLTQK